MSDEKASTKCPESCTCERCFERPWLIAQIQAYLREAPLEELREAASRHAPHPPSLVEAS